MAVLMQDAVDAAVARAMAARADNPDIDGMAAAAVDKMLMLTSAADPVPPPTHQDEWRAQMDAAFM